MEHPASISAQKAAVTTGTRILYCHLLAVSPTSPVKMSSAAQRGSGKKNIWMFGLHLSGSTTPLVKAKWHLMGWKVESLQCSQAAQIYSRETGRLNATELSEDCKSRP